MNLTLRCLFLLVLAAILVDIALRSPWTVKRPMMTRTGAAVLMVSIEAAVAYSALSGALNTRVAQSLSDAPRPDVMPAPGPPALTQEQIKAAGQKTPPSASRTPSAPRAVPNSNGDHSKQMTPEEVANEVVKRLPPPATQPPFGNLRDRANTLADEIMQDLYRHGWKGRKPQADQAAMPVMPMPAAPEERQQWTRSRSQFFRFRFFPAVLDIRNEFTQLHLRDQRLDDFLKYQGMAEQANQQILAISTVNRQIEIPILPMEIEEVAERLRVLGSQAIQRAAPKELKFSALQVQPEKGYAFGLLVTIETERVISRGCLAVKFDGDRTYMATDFVGGKFRSPFDIEGNDQLRDYLKAYGTNVYAIEIVDTPFMPEKPIHVIAYGMQSFRVSRVTLFD
jgi:hypothetical protein